MCQYKMLINGEHVEGASSIDVINPATGAPFAQCPVADRAQLDAAVAAAQAAFRSWSAQPLEARAQRLIQLADALECRAIEFANLLTSEQGKPHDQALFEVQGAVHGLRAFAAMRIEPRVLRKHGESTITEVRSPLGVVAAITPWNFPLQLLINKLGPALLAGNTLIAKPAPTTPLTTLLLGELCLGIFPDGVVNFICDSNDLGDALTSHSGVAKVSFTGSTATGKKVMQGAATSIKRLTLELGGNDAAIVLADADPRRTAAHIFQGAMVNAGQVCIAVKRAYVPSDLYDAFCEELVRLAEATVVDDGSKQGTQVGPVQNLAQYERLKDLLQDSARDGRIVAGGYALDRDGYFIAPTIVRDLSENARLVREEQFGPILPVLRYDDIEDAIARVNESDYGLAGTVWGSDLRIAAEVASRIDAGTVWVNQHMAIEADIPFRGAKQSGFGGELGLEGLHEYTQARIINIVPA